MVSLPVTRVTVIGFPGPWATALLTSSVTTEVRSVSVAAGSRPENRCRSALRALQPARRSGERTSRNSSGFVGPLLASMLLLLRADDQAPLVEGTILTRGMS